MGHFYVQTVTNITASLESVFEKFCEMKKFNFFYPKDICINDPNPIK